MELIKHQRIMIKDESLEHHFDDMKIADINKYEYYISWGEDNDSKVIYCKHKPTMSWWRRGDVPNSNGYDVPEDCYISCFYVYDNEIKHMVKATKLAKKIYPNAEEKDGWLLV